MAQQKTHFTLIIIIMILFLSIFRVATFITDYMWFKALGVKNVFMISFQATLLLFGISTVVFFIFLATNLYLSSKFKSSNLLSVKTKLGISILVSLFAGTAASSGWLEFLRYIYQVPFNLADPILGKDVAYYVFSLPFLLNLWKFALSVVLITIILVLLDYFQGFIASFFRQQAVNVKFEITKLKKAADCSFF